MPNGVVIPLEDATKDNKVFSLSNEVYLGYQDPPNEKKLLGRLPIISNILKYPLFLLRIFSHVV